MSLEPSALKREGFKWKTLFEQQGIPSAGRQQRLQLCSKNSYFYGLLLLVLLLVLLIIGRTTGLQRQSFL